MRADEYASIHGPTTGDRIQLGDTGLVIEVESDSQLTGDEFLMGFGKTARDIDATEVIWEFFRRHVRH